MLSRIQTLRLCNIRPFINISVSMASVPNIETLNLKDGKTLVYEKLNSSRPNSKTVIYVPGLQSGKDGIKVNHLRQYCLENDLSFISSLPADDQEMLDSGEVVYIKH